MDPVTFLFIFSMVSAGWVTKVIQNGRTDREYAKQSMVSPRYQKSLKRLETAGISPRVSSDGRTGPARAYAANVWADSWLDLAERRKAKRAARPPYVYDPNRPKWHQRVDAAVLAGVQRVKDGYNRLAEQGTPKPPRPDVVEEPALAADLPAGTWTIGDAGQRVPLADEVAPPLLVRYPHRGGVIAVTNGEEDDPTWAGDPGGLREEDEGAYDDPITADEVVVIRRDMYGLCSHPTASATSAGAGDFCTVRICDHDWHHPPSGNTYCCYHTVAKQRAASPDTSAHEHRDAVHGTQIPPDTQEEPMTMTMTESEIHTNEDARRNFQAIASAAAEASDALAAYEAAQAKLAALASGGADGMSAKAFDRGATDAQFNISDLLPPSSMSAAAGAIDGIKAEADAGVRHLDKYRDSESQVATERIDPTTLAATSS